MTETKTYGYRFISPRDSDFSRDEREKRDLVSDSNQAIDIWNEAGLRFYGSEVLTRDDTNPDLRIARLNDKNVRMVVRNIIANQSPLGKPLAVTRLTPAFVAPTVVPNNGRLIDYPGSRQVLLLGPKGRKLAADFVGKSLGVINRINTKNGVSAAEDESTAIDRAQAYFEAHENPKRDPETAYYINTATGQWF